MGKGRANPLKRKEQMMSDNKIIVICARTDEMEAGQTEGRQPGGSWGWLCASAGTC